MSDIYSKTAKLFSFYSHHFWRAQSIYTLLLLIYHLLECSHTPPPKASMKTAQTYLWVINKETEPIIWISNAFWLSLILNGIWRKETEHMRVSHPFPATSFFPLFSKIVAHKRKQMQRCILQFSRHCWKWCIPTIQAHQPVQTATVHSHVNFSVKIFINCFCCLLNWGEKLCWSVIKSCLTLHEPMDSNMPGLLISNVFSNSCSLLPWHYLTTSSSALDPFFFCQKICDFLIFIYINYEHCTQGWHQDCVLSICHTNSPW